MSIYKLFIASDLLVVCMFGMVVAPFNAGCASGNGMQKRIGGMFKQLLTISAVGACVCLSSVHATQHTLSVGWKTVGNANVDDYIVGNVIPHIQGGQGGQAEGAVTMINELRQMSLNSTAIDGTTLFARSENNFVTLPQATTQGAMLNGSMSFSGSMVNIALSGQFTYLVAAYDGQNSGAAIWNISDFQVGDTVAIPAYAKPLFDLRQGNNVFEARTDNVLVDGYNAGSGSKYQITHWTLLGPITNVPDGGTTMILLGCVMTFFGLIRRKLV